MKSRLFLASILVLIGLMPLAQAQTPIGWTAGDIGAGDVGQFFL